MGSPVRIAGVDVGKVTKLETNGDGAATVTMELRDDALPLHRTPTLKIRPRILLEGNYFVDIQPGHAVAPPCSTTAEPSPITQTATAVPLPEILSTLTTDTRNDLRTLLARVRHRGARQRRRGGASTSRFPTSSPAYRRTALTNDALLGAAAEPRPAAAAARPGADLRRAGQPARGAQGPGDRPRHRWRARWRSQDVGARGVGARAARHAARRLPGAGRRSTRALPTAARLLQSRRSPACAPPRRRSTRRSRGSRRRARSCSREELRGLAADLRAGSARPGEAQQPARAAARAAARAVVVHEPGAGALRRVRRSPASRAGNSGQQVRDRSSAASWARRREPHPRRQHAGLPRPGRDPVEPGHGQDRAGRAARPQHAARCTGRTWRARRRTRPCWRRPAARPPPTRGGAP